MDLSELPPVRSNQANYQKQLRDAGGWSFFELGAMRTKGKWYFNGRDNTPLHIIDHEVLISDFDRFQKVARCVNLFSDIVDLELCFYHLHHFTQHFSRHYTILHHSTYHRLQPDFKCRLKENSRSGHMGQTIKKWTKQNLWKTAFKKYAIPLLFF